MYVAKTANTWGVLVRATPSQARSELAALLIRHEGNIRAMAAEMKVGRVTVYRWLEGLGMQEAPALARRGEPLPWATHPAPSSVG